MNEIDLAYMAGFFDGEGCITINKMKPKGNGNRNYVYRIYCLMVSNDKAILTWMQQIVGGSISTTQKVGYRPNWRWCITDNKALAFLKQICPYLQIKKQEAELAIAYQEWKQRLPNKGQCRPPKELSIMEQAYQILREVKLVRNTRRENQNAPAPIQMQYMW